MVKNRLPGDLFRLLCKYPNQVRVLFFGFVSTETGVI